jgi:uncharacterized protein YndB with AHSA1/START domain
MATVSEKVQINATPQEVWTYITDLDKMRQWRTDIETVNIIDRGEPRVGNQFSIQKEVQGSLRTFTTTITEIEEHHRFGFTAESKGFATVKALYEIIPEERGCSFVINEKIEVTGMGFLNPFVDRLFIQRGLSKTIREYLTNLEQIIESEG